MNNSGENAMRNGFFELFAGSGELKCFDLADHLLRSHNEHLNLSTKKLKFSNTQLSNFAMKLDQTAENCFKSQAFFCWHLNFPLYDIGNIRIESHHRLLQIITKRNKKTTCTKIQNIADAINRSRCWKKNGEHYLKVEEIYWCPDIEWQPKSK